LTNISSYLSNGIEQIKSAERALDALPELPVIKVDVAPFAFELLQQIQQFINVNTLLHSV